MTAYVARKGAQKKKEILAKRVEGLRNAIHNAQPISKIEKETERVREAQIKVVECLIYESVPVTTDEQWRRASHRKHLKDRLSYWKSLSVVGVIGQCLPELANGVARRWID